MPQNCDCESRTCIVVGKSSIRGVTWKSLEMGTLVVHDKHTGVMVIEGGGRKPVGQ
jgi:hypothetical protein